MCAQCVRVECDKNIDSKKEKRKLNRDLVQRIDINKQQIHMIFLFDFCFSFHIIICLSFGFNDAIGNQISFSYLLFSLFKTEISMHNSDSKGIETKSMHLHFIQSKWFICSFLHFNRLIFVKVCILLFFVAFFAIYLYFFMVALVTFILFK